MGLAVKKTRKTSFYLVIGVVAVLAVFVGFLSTYITPSLKGTLSAPPVVHIHGALAAAWVVLFLLQAMLVRYRNFPLHKTLGYAGLAIALGIMATMLPVGLFQVKRDLALGLGDTAISPIVGVATTAMVFGLLVGMGFVYRKKPKVHKRLLLLATIVLLWPAWFRFRHYFPSVPRPDIWFGVVLADSLIVLAWVVDRITHGKVHPVLLYGGLLIIVEHVCEILLFDTEGWRVWAKALYGALAG